MKIISGSSIIAIVLIVIYITGGIVAAESSKEDSYIGIVVAIKGNVSARRQGESQRALEIKSKVYQSDVIKTGESSRVQVLFNDNTVFSLGASGELKLVDYVYKPELGKARLLTDVKQGAFKVKAGGTAKISPNSFVTETPVASIGIRGSMYAGIVDNEGLKAVFLGGKGIYVKNKAGEVDISKVGVGFDIPVNKEMILPVPRSFSNSEMNFIQAAAVGMVDIKGKNEQIGSSVFSSEDIAVSSAVSGKNNQEENKAQGNESENKSPVVDDSTSSVAIFDIKDKNKYLDENKNDKSRDLGTDRRTVNRELNNANNINTLERDIPGYNIVDTGTSNGPNNNTDNGNTNNNNINDLISKDNNLSLNFRENDAAGNGLINYNVGTNLISRSLVLDNGEEVKKGYALFDTTDNDLRQTRAIGKGVVFIDGRVDSQQLVTFVMPSWEKYFGELTAPIETVQSNYIKDLGGSSWTYGNKVLNNMDRTNSNISVSQRLDKRYLDNRASQSLDSQPNLEYRFGSVFGLSKYTDGFLETFSDVRLENLVLDIKTAQVYGNVIAGERNYGFGSSTMDTYGVVIDDNNFVATIKMPVTSAYNNERYGLLYSGDKNQQISSDNARWGYWYAVNKDNDFPQRRRNSIEYGYWLVENKNAKVTDFSSWGLRDNFVAYYSGLARFYESNSADSNVIREYVDPNGTNLKLVLHPGKRILTGNISGNSVDGNNVVFDIGSVEFINDKPLNAQHFNVNSAFESINRNGNINRNITSNITGTFYGQDGSQAIGGFNAISHGEAGSYNYSGIWTGNRYK